MKLSELSTGQKGVIVKVLGHGGFRKRIVEMGFIKGQEVEVLLNAPLHDPVKYKIMGYEVSLRHTEASMIEIITESEARNKDIANPDTTEENGISVASNNEQDTEFNNLHEEALKKRRIINVALVGNPNCGKTSFFNYASGAHERVGNYSGVTVDAKEGRAEYKGYNTSTSSTFPAHTLSLHTALKNYT